MKKKQKPNPKKIVEQRQLEFHSMFSQGIDEVDRLLRSNADTYIIHNKLINIRNKCRQFIADSLSEILAATKHQVKIKTAIEQQVYQAKREFQKPCEICGEKRITNLCHVIPKSEGGGDSAGNILFLCPTHHFLFDHARLTKAEFDIIDDSKLTQAARDYLYRVHRSRHEMKWRYKTNTFGGCNCGSREFNFIAYDGRTYVAVALRCNNCGAIWLNLWEELHPITKAAVVLWDPTENISPEEKESRKKKAIRKIQKFIDEEVPRILREGV